jgi:hypothetical protein
MAIVECECAAGFCHLLEAVQANEDPSYLVYVLCLLLVVGVNFGTFKYGRWFM